jgi:hypothetical protein
LYGCLPKSQARNAFKARVISRGERRKAQYPRQSLEGGPRAAHVAERTQRALWHSWGNMLGAGLKPHLVNGGWIERDGERVRLLVPPTSASAYTDAQLDDYDHALPRRFANHPPQRLKLWARFSHPAGVLKGTAGFGFWNHPFTRQGAVLEPPRNVWFFYSSPESRAPVGSPLPGHGFYAAVVNSPLPTTAGGGALTKGLIRLGNLALRLPGISALALAIGQALVQARAAPLALDMTAWHCYELEWLPTTTRFCVNGQEVMRTRSPAGPLGFVAWIDNYRVIAGRGGGYAFGFVETSQVQWLELRLEEGLAS